MNDLETFDDALNGAIDALARGQRIRDVLALHPRHAEALHPLLESAMAMQTDSVTSHVPVPSRLGDHYVIVRAAVERAQIAERAFMPAARAAASGAPWWKRRLTFASLTLPLGAVALIAFAGAGSAAAAASVATGGDGGISTIGRLPSNVASSVRAVNPFAGGAPSGNGGALATASSTAGGENSDGTAPGSASAPTTGDASGNGTAPASNAPGSTATNRPTEITVSGVISDVHGGNFTLTAGKDAWHVTIDGTTTINGAIEDGASASMRGTVTATKNLHADEVDVSAPGTAPTAPDATATDTPHGDKTPGPPAGQTPDQTPANGDRTPSAPDKTKTGEEQTPGPPDDRTPPGQGGDGGGSGEHGSGGGSVKP